MDLDLAGKTALITGSSKGLGKACALRIADEGADVAICARSLGPLENTAEEIRSKTEVNVLAKQADMLNPNDIEDVVSETEETLGQIDIAIANAGGPPVGAFEEFDDQDWQNAFELNLLSSVRIARQTVPPMADRGWGRMLFITSVATKQPIEGFILSNSVRRGIAGLAKTLSNRYASDGVTVNCVLPGYTRTERLEDIPDERHEQITSEIPTGRFGDPDEFANAVVFLASERASYISGISLPIDGGFIDSVF